MVSLRSGSTTDHHEAEGQPEVASKRRTSRQSTNASAPESGLPSPAATKRASQAPRKIRSRRRAILSAIDESPSGAPEMTEEEEFEAVQHGAEAAAEEALHTARRAVDTPARNTRARRGITALPPPRIQGASDLKPRGEAQEEPQSSAAQQESSPKPSESGSHAGLLVRAPQGTLGQSAGTSDASKQTGGLQQSLAAGIAAAAPEVQHSSGADHEQSQSPEPAQAEPSASSSGWSSEEQDGEEAGVLGRMAQSMLAALSPLQRGGPNGTALAGLHGQNGHHDIAARRQKQPAAPASARFAPRGARQLAVAGDSKVPEVRWNPAVQLPALQTADGGLREDILSRVEPVPEGQLTAPPRDANRIAREARKAAPDTAGSDWYDLPAPQITDEVKRDLRLLRLRGVMDPKRFYKSADQTKFPKYFQFGTVVEGPTEFYSGRMTRKERKQTLTEELLADPELAHSRRKRFGALQQEKQRWGRKKGRQTNNERKKVYKRPRH